MAELLRGDLRRIGIPSVLQLAEAESVTGRIEVEGCGVIDVWEGQPVQARCASLDGLSAFLEIFLLPSESFRVVADPGVEGRPLGAVVGLIMEGCRLADEWRRIAALPLAAVEEAAHEPVPAPMDRVLPYLASEPSVEHAVLRAGVARANSIDPLLDLLHRGHLRERTRPPAPTRVEAAPKPDYYVAMERGRALLRDGSFDAALAAFEAALRARPNDRVALQNLRRVRQVQEGSDGGLLRWFRART